MSMTHEQARQALHRHGTIARLLLSAAAARGGAIPISSTDEPYARGLADPTATPDGPAASYVDGNLILTTAGWTTYYADSGFTAEQVAPGRPLPAVSWVRP